MHVSVRIAVVVAALAGSSSGAAADTGCGAAVGKALVRSFVRDYAAREIATVERMWAPEPRFRWFSAGPPQARLGGAAYDRSTLRRYFRTRVRRHERIRIVALEARYDPRREIVNFAGRLLRRADDIRTPRVHDFKGAASCAAGPELIVWSM
jgi:hypothetical protein